MKFALIALFCLCLALHADCSAAGKRHANTDVNHLVSLIVSQAEKLQKVTSKLELQEAKLQQQETQLQQQKTQLQQQETQLQQQETQLEQQKTKQQQQEIQLQQQKTKQQQQDTKQQQQETGLQQLQDEVESLEASQKECRAGLNAVINSTHPKQVAFSATYEGWKTKNVGTHGTLKYDQVITNIGNGYASHTGLFTAPYAGVYAFFTSLRTRIENSWISVGLYKGKTRLVLVYAEGKGDPWDINCAYVTTHLSKGDQVYLRHVSGSTYFDSSPHTSFSGMLVSAD